jgi:hypothetical protein
LLNVIPELQVYIFFHGNFVRFWPRHDVVGRMAATSKPGGEDKVKNSAEGAETVNISSRRLPPESPSRQFSDLVL